MDVNPYESPRENSPTDGPSQHNTFASRLITLTVCFVSALLFFSLLIAIVNSFLFSFFFDGTTLAPQPETSTISSAIRRGEATP